MVAEEVVLQLLAARASSVAKKGTGHGIAPTQALEAEEGLAGVGVMEVARARGMGLQGVGAMGVVKGMEGAQVLGAQVLFLVHAINVASQDTGQIAAQTDALYCSDKYVHSTFLVWV